MAGLLPALPQLGSPGYSAAPPQTPAQQVLGTTLGGALDSLNNAITPTAVQNAGVAAGNTASATLDAWTAIGNVAALLSDVQRMATIAAGIVFLLAGLRLLGGKA